MKNRNKRIVDKIKEEWKKTESGLDRGIITMGARAFRQPPQNDLKKLDFILKSRKVVLEEYPILNWKTNMGKGILKTVKDGIVSKGQAGGSFIYELNIPVISNFAGELCGVREEGAKSGVSSTVGALTKGILVDGLGGTVEGLANVMVDPIEAIGGLLPFWPIQMRHYRLYGKVLKVYGMTRL